MTNDTTANAPKVFISYSWTSQAYADRVVELAERLRGDGVDVVLDRWHLREGHDKHAFMERSVTDPQISRVLILCDPLYAERADGRAGGVGTEALIISPNVYREAAQEKFVPVLMEKTASGDVRVPTYLDGRIYIDLSDPEREAQGYEQLLRNIFGKPALAPPPLGKRPSFLDDDAPQLRTGFSLKAYKDAVLRSQPVQGGRLEDYLDRLAEAFAEERFSEQANVSDHAALDEWAADSVTRFTAYRNEFLDLIAFISRYGDFSDAGQRLHNFFEKLVAIRFRHVQRRWNWEHETENLGFIARELFLYAVAGLVRAGRFAAVAGLLEPYFVETDRAGPGALRGFDVLDPGGELFDRFRNDRLKLNKISLTATLLQERATHPDIPFEALIEADALLWFRATLPQPGVVEWGWYLRTLIYRNHVDPLPLFARLRVPSFFERAREMLGSSTYEEFVAILAQAVKQRRFSENRLLSHPYSVARLFGVEEELLRTP